MMLPIYRLDMQSMGMYSQNEPQCAVFCAQIQMQIKKKAVHQQPLALGKERFYKVAFSPRLWLMAFLKKQAHPIFKAEAKSKMFRV